jgi:hypothetical protein
MKRPLAVARSVVVIGWFVLAPGLVGRAGADDPKDARRHTDKAGGFSFVMPEDWKVREIPGLKYRIVHGPPAAGFAPNINVVDEAFKGGVEDYVTACLPLLQRTVENLRIEKRGAFRTESGLDGVRLITESRQQGRQLRQVAYFFCTGEKAYVVTCTALADGGDQLDPLFERTMKTFRLEGRGDETKAGP